MLMDVDRYKQHTAALDIADLDLSRFSDQPLDADTLRCIRYMHDVENHTICYLRDLLVTPAHQDPDITAFLTFWSFEEYWHGEALGRILAAHGESSDQRIRDTRRRLPAKDRLAPLVHLAGSALAGESFIAIHMSWGAVNEWTTQAGYARLAARSGDPLLGEILARIMRQEGRHIDFYAAQAAQRLAGDRRARTITRWALKHLWAPVGSGVMPASETRFLVRHLFSGGDGRKMAERIDRRIDRLPGLAGLGLIQGALGAWRPR
jgi:hypothetical protein